MSSGSQVASSALQIPTPVLLALLVVVALIAIAYVYRPKREPATVVDAITAVFG